MILTNTSRFTNYKNSNLPRSISISSSRKRHHQYAKYKFDRGGGGCLFIQEEHLWVITYSLEFGGGVGARSSHPRKPGPSAVGSQAVGLEGREERLGLDLTRWDLSLSRHPPHPPPHPHRRADRHDGIWVRSPLTGQMVKISPPTQNPGWCWWCW